MDFIAYSQQTINNLSLLQEPDFLSNFQNASEILIECLNSGGNILICGNGGSHSDALHFAGELVNYFTREHRALPVIALGTNGAVLTAWSNDHAFENQFAREVEAYGNHNSILIGVTTSGNSQNVNNAFQVAKKMGMKCIALASQKAIPNLPKDLDCILAAPVNETHKIQECHIVIYHALCIAIEESL